MYADTFSANVELSCINNINIILHTLPFRVIVLSHCNIIIKSRHELKHQKEFKSDFKVVLYSTTEIIYRRTLRVYVTERSVVGAQITCTVLGGLDSIVCVLHKSANSDM